MTESWRDVFLLLFQGKITGQTKAGRSRQGTDYGYEFYGFREDTKEIPC